MAMEVAPSFPTWEEIELAENYMVCCMYQEAAALSSSIIEQLVDKNVKTNEPNCEFGDMLESAAMILMQSCKASERTSEILKQLKVLFGSVTAIPAQVFLTGVCLQIPDGPSAEVQEILEEFLMKWRYVDGKYYTVASMEADVPYVEEFSNQISLGVDKYLEIIELYVITFLGRILGNFDLAISWVEKSPLPEEKRQDLLRRLHSMNTLKLGSSLQSSALPLQIDECTTDSSSLVEEKSCNGTTNILEHRDQSKGENTTKQSILDFSRRRTPFWWFRTVTLKFGSSRLVLSNGSIFLGFLVALVYYIARRKQASLWSIVKRQASSTKKALVDFWQLAFSYQVNPLAAVQPLPPATRGSR
ncbi:protein APEM9-like [Solanum lycopersicum]|uniref:3-phosphoinositide-dependent protein kinase-1 n=1 Tax=Solanum lycopersicum TaxID=4081 RepID=A0A3Q7JTY4_SOLLC|nr:protein APEM9-like [Solanum lycopersicum]XP_010313976.1 protein APEM9-like [Solanum lycopersicum]